MDEKLLPPESWKNPVTGYTYVEISMDEWHVIERDPDYRIVGSDEGGTSYSNSKGDTCYWDADAGKPYRYREDK